MGVEYRRWRSKEASAAAVVPLVEYQMGVEYQQDHSVEVPVDTKKLPQQSVGWVLQGVFNNIPMKHTDDRI